MNEITDAANFLEHKIMGIDRPLPFDIDGPMPFDVDDVVETTEEIRRGQMVWFDRIGRHRVVVRVLSAEEASIFAGDAYRLDRGRQPGSIRLERVSLEPGEAGAPALEIPHAPNDNSQSPDDGAGIAALELAAKPNYLGSPEVVSGLVGRIFETSIDKYCKRLGFGDWDKENIRISRIFGGEGPDFTIMPGWHTAEALGKAVVSYFDMDADYFRGECLVGIMSEGFAAVSLQIDKILKGFEEDGAAEWQRDALPQLNRLHQFVCSVLMGTNEVVFPGAHLKDFVWGGVSQSQ
ncbi:MAG: hypothetical protein ACLQNE_26420 [Thermoguttaceae bacterium]